MLLSHHRKNPCNPATPKSKQRAPKKHFLSSGTHSSQTSFCSLTSCKVRAEISSPLSTNSHNPLHSCNIHQKTKKNLHLTCHMEVTEVLTSGKNSNSWSWKEQEKQLDNMAEQSVKSFLQNLTTAESNVENSRSSAERLVQLLHQPTD